MVDRHGDDPGPDGPHDRWIDGSLERIGLADRLERLQGLVQPAGQLTDEQHRGRDGAEEQDARLDDVGPDHRRYPAQHGVGDGHHGNDEDRQNHVDAGDEFQHQRRGVQHDSGIGDVPQQEDGGHHGSRGQPEAPLQVVEDGRATAVVEERQKQRGDDEDGDGVVDVDEDDRESVHIGPGRSAEKSERPDIGRDNRDSDGPPGRRALADEVVLRGLHSLAQEEPEDEIADDIDDQDRPVENAEVADLHVQCDGEPFKNLVESERSLV